MARVCLALLVLISCGLPSGWSQEPPVKAPLGSKENPVRCDDVDGEHAYLSRLRDSAGKPITAMRFGSASEPSPFGGILDVYGIEIEDGQRGKIYLDMYHRAYICTSPIPGLRILFEQDERYEYIDGKIHALGDEQPFSGDIESTDPAGNILAKCKVKAGMIEGKQTYFYSDGSPKVEYPFSKGVRHGVAVWYRENGKIWSELPFVEGRLEGIQTVYSESGAIQNKVPYKNHQEHGTVKIFYEQGGIRQSIDFKHGVRDGFDVQYDSTGNVTDKTKYVDGEAQQK